VRQKARPILGYHVIWILQGVLHLSAQEWHLPVSCKLVCTKNFFRCDDKCWWYLFSWPGSCNCRQLSCNIHSDGKMPVLHPAPWVPPISELWRPRQASHKIPVPLSEGCFWHPQRGCCRSAEVAEQAPSTFVITTKKGRVQTNLQDTVTSGKWHMWSVWSVLSQARKTDLMCLVKAMYLSG